MFNYQLPNIPVGTDDFGSGGPALSEYLLAQLSRLTTQKQNLHGRRVGQAKDAINLGDYVTKRQVAQQLFGTMAQRPDPKAVVSGTTYFATDRGVTYQSRYGHWWYFGGVQFVTLSPDTKPTPSILYDNGYRIYSTDFDWFYHWDLITWVREGGANFYIQGFTIAPTKPGWALCDGATVTFSADNGSTTSGTIQDLVSTARFLKFGSTSAFIAAVAPTLSGNTGSGGGFIPEGTVTGNLPDHTHGVSFTSGTGTLTLSGSVATAITGTITRTTDCDLVVSQEGLDNTDVAICSHDHDFNLSLNDGTVTFGGDGTHTHAIEGTTVGINENPTALDLTFTGTPVSSHTHGAGTLAVSSTGAPIAIQLIPYIRL